MSEVKITRTTALYPSAVFVQWDIDSPESGAFLVDIARAEGPTGPWESIAVGKLNAYNFLDNQFNIPPAVDTAAGREGTNLFSLARVIYYQITVTPPSGTANTFVSKPTPVEPELDRRTRLFKRKILHDEAVGYKRLNGIRIVVLKRRRWGERCPQCYDPVTGESTLEHCLACFGTSFLGGYWAPTLIRGRRETATVQTQVTSHGDSDVKQADFNILDYPLVEYKDIIVDVARNERYQVQRVHHTELKSVTVHQKVTASSIGRNSVEYSLLIDPDNIPPLY